MGKYNTPGTGSPTGTPSSVGPQFNTFYYDRNAIIEAEKEQFFLPLADAKNMPKHYGKEIRMFHYLPLLDDRNINDQGLDASGAQIANGNLYGSSKDIGTITSRIPALTENGGRVNRVGFKRMEIKGDIKKLGFFFEFTDEEIMFDTDEELYEHYSAELVKGASQISEALLQVDLLLGAGVVQYPGSATNDGEMSAEVSLPSIIDYDDLSALATELYNNRTPLQTTVIKGSRMTDTRTISAGRVMYIGSELESTVKRITDPFGNPAFIPVSQYADAGDVLNGEIGTVDQFRIVVVPEMLHWAGAGASVGTNPGYRATDGKYDIFPMLVVGDKSFVSIGFQHDGKSKESVKFKIHTKMPGKETADRNDPFGEMGFSSIKWWYGTVIPRPERLAVAKSLARR